VRVVSLLASASEIVCALDAGDTLVGRSHECDNPEWVRALPACTRPAFDIEASSRAIDAEVRRRLAAGEPLYHVDTALIDRLHPDLLVTQVHCDVCSVTPGDLARSAGAPVRQSVLALSAGTIDGIFGDVSRIAGALDRSAEGERLVARMRERLRAVRASVAGRAPPTLVMMEWTDPVFAMANWGPELVEIANGRLLLGEGGRLSHAISWDEVRAADPQVLIVAPCGFSLERSLREAEVLEALPGWFEMKAVREGRVVFADGNRYFNRSGTTIVETAAILAEILHGDTTAPRWRGTAWSAYAPLSRSQ